MSTNLIGLAGYAGSGKDAAATVLTSECGWTREAFGDGIRAAALGAVKHLRYLGPRTWWLLGRRRYRTEELSVLVDRLGWEGVKALPEGRAMLQDVGATGRACFGQDAWTERVMWVADATAGPVVITDVRYPAEADAIRAAGGRVVRVTRPGTGPVNAHQSETALEGYPFDAVITNDGTLDELHDKVRQLAASAT